MDSSPIKKNDTATATPSPSKRKIEDTAIDASRDNVEGDNLESPAKKPKKNPVATPTIPRSVGPSVPGDEERDDDKSQSHQEDRDDDEDGYDGQGDYDNEGDHQDEGDDGDEAADYDETDYHDEYDVEPYIPELGEGDLGPLGGVYKVRVQAPWRENTWTSLILPEANVGLWGDFTIGPLSGMLWIPTGPIYASQQKIQFEIRARDKDGLLRASSLNSINHIKFLHDHQIAGEIRYKGTEWLEFYGFKSTWPIHQGPRWKVSAEEMQRKWEELGDASTSRGRT